MFYEKETKNGNSGGRCQVWEWTGSLTILTFSSVLFNYFENGKVLGQGTVSSLYLLVIIFSKTSVPNISHLFNNLVIYLHYLLTYLLTPRCRVLLEKLTGLQLVKKFPAFHGTRRFISALTSVRQASHK